jgi:hypothetical protein
MILKRVFLFFALTTLCLCVANAKQEKATCGSGRGVGAPFNFEYSYSKNTTRQKQATFSAINCPKLSQNSDKEYEVVLDNIDFKSGTYVCQYNIKEGKSQEEIQSEAKNLGVTVSNVVMQQSGFRIPYSFSECVKDDLKFINEQKDRISTITAATINDGSAEARYIGSSRTKLSEIQKGLLWNSKITVMSELEVKYAEPYKTLKELEAKKDDYSVKPIVFQTNKTGNDTTISEFIVGALTLDEDAFKSPNAIDQASGKANFSDSPIITKDTEEKNSFREFGETVLESIGLLFWDKDNVKVVSPLEKIMDGKLWGFYISFIENIRKAERDIILFLFFIGFCVYVTPKVVQFGYNHFGGEDSKQDIGWKKMMIAPATATIFFLAPIIPTNLTINGSYLHTRTDNDVGIVLNNKSTSAGSSSSAEEKLDSTTLVQLAIQYFVKQGTLMANKFADYALHPYLIYLQSVNNMSVGNIVDSYKTKLDETRQDFLILQKEVEFYSAFCKSIYGAQSNTAYDGVIMPEALSGTLKTDREALTEKSYNAGKDTGLKNNNITTISVDGCAAIEQSISKHSSNTIADYYFAKTAIESLKDIKAKSSTQTMHNVSQRIANMQVANGWINAALVPSSFTLYKSSLLGQTLEDRKNAAVAYQNAASVNNNSITTNSPSDDVKAQESKNDTRGFSKQSIVELLTPSTLYFMLPKFTDLYNGIDKFFGGFVDILMTVCTTLLVTTTGGIGAIFIAVLGAAISLGKAIAVYFTSVFLYNWLLEIITFSAIALMIVYRIAFYFIEVLMFFVASPAVVIWAVVSKRFDSIMHYIGRGAVLSITPILIVLSTYLYIFGQEILNMIYALIVGIIQTTFVTPDATIGQTITVLAFVAMGDTIMKAVYLIMAFVCIIKFNSWFYQMIGIKEGAMSDIAQTISDKTSALYSPIR